MATKPKAKKWKLYEGVGFQPDSDPEREWSPAPHCVVLMQSMHSGTDVYGPFTSEDAAYKWIREEGDGELYGNFNRGSVAGVTFHVKWLDVPVTRDNR